ncbi:MAG: AbrB/MazE/SpoVT family DNA-binding domain-containing protein [Acidobacteriota bacterium]
MAKRSRARLFKNGGSQAVRLPREFRFEGQAEVFIRRKGQEVILEPVDEWPDAFKASLGQWPEDIERPPQQPVEELKDPFE